MEDDVSGCRVDDGLWIVGREQECWTRKEAAAVTPGRVLSLEFSDIPTHS